MTAREAATNVNKPATEPMTRLEDVRAAHNVVAAISDLDAARDAIIALERDGIAPEEISLLGARPEPDTSDPRPVASNVASGAGVGAVAGSAVGALASLVIPGIGPAVGAGIWAAAGAGTGGVVGGLSAMSASDAWRHTFEAVEDGNVAVGVHTDDPERAATAYETLAALSPLAVNRFDA